MTFIKQLLLKKQGPTYAGAMALVDTREVCDRLILLAGGTSTVGLAVAGALLEAGARVVIAGRDQEKLGRAQAIHREVHTSRADLTNEVEVVQLASRVRDEFGPVDGVFHLVGGWRGGGGLAGQSESDFRFLEHSLSSLRHVSRAFNSDIANSPRGRTAIVSSTAVRRPLAGGANYVAIKAASEAWIRAVGQGFAHHAQSIGRPLTASAVIYRVRGLEGLEDAVAQSFVGLWDEPLPLQSVTEVDLSGL